MRLHLPNLGTLKTTTSVIIRARWCAHMEAYECKLARASNNLIKPYVRACVESLSCSRMPKARTGALACVCVCVYAAHLNINSKCLGCHNNISFQYAAHNAREQPSKAHNERREHVAGYLHEAQSNEGSWAG